MDLLNFGLHIRLETGTYDSILCVLGPPVLSDVDLYSSQAQASQKLHPE